MSTAGALGFDHFSFCWPQKPFEAVERMGFGGIQWWAFRDANLVIPGGQPPMLMTLAWLTNCHKPKKWGHPPQNGQKKGPSMGRENWGVPNFHAFPYSKWSQITSVGSFWDLVRSRSTIGLEKCDLRRCLATWHSSGQGHDTTEFCPSTDRDLGWSKGI